MTLELSLDLKHTCMIEQQNALKTIWLGGDEPFSRLYEYIRLTQWLSV